MNPVCLPDIEEVRNLTLELSEAIYAGVNHSDLTTIVDKLRVAVFIKVKRYFITED